MVAGFGDVGKGLGGFAAAGPAAACCLRDRPDLARLQAAMEGYEVTTWRTPDARRHFRHRDRQSRRSSTIEHMRKMKDRRIVANIGHFDSEIQWLRCGTSSGTTSSSGRRDRIPGQQAHHPALGRKRLVNLGNAMGHPSS